MGEIVDSQHTSSTPASLLLSSVTIITEILMSNCGVAAVMSVAGEKYKIFLKKCQGYVPPFTQMAKCLMNSEVALILEDKYEQIQQMSDDPANQVSQVFEKSLQYVKRFSRYKNPDAVRQVREILSRYQLAEFELNSFLCASLLIHL